MSEYLVKEVLAKDLKVGDTYQNYDKKFKTILSIKEQDGDIQISYPDGEEYTNPYTYYLIQTVPQENVVSEEWIEKFKPFVYCFMGSGMLTNSYDEDVAIKMARICFKIAQAYALSTAKPITENAREIDWKEVLRVIENSIISGPDAYRSSRNIFKYIKDKFKPFHSSEKLAEIISEFEGNIVGGSKIVIGRFPITEAKKLANIILGNNNPK